MELFRFDEHFAGRLRASVAGVDEVGRGPLAGPVVAACVIFRRKTYLPLLNDSKKLSPKTREFLFREIALGAFIGIGKVSEAVIDQINILEATRLAMREAILAVPRTPEIVLIDGNIHLDLPLQQRAIVRGDSQSAAIAAASIVAKVYRDSLMKDLHTRYPEYGFSVHKGYPTPEHLRVLQLKGASPVHRRTFRPVAEALSAVLSTPQRDIEK